MDAAITSLAYPVVTAAREADYERAASLAELLQTKALLGHEAEGAVGLRLVLGEEGLVLTDGTLSMSGDFTKMIPRIKQGVVQRELLVKAARIKGLEETQVVVDATAGMGEDSLLLAAAGFEVHLFELNPVIAALLADTLARSAQIPELKDAVGRMHLTQGDSVAGLRNLGFAPHVVLLDPMFPARQKSALVKKKFQLLHQLESPCSNEGELMEAALASRPARIVVKRPPKGPHLAGVKPSYSLEGKAVRYDCIVPANK